MKVPPSKARMWIGPIALIAAGALALALAAAAWMGDLWLYTPLWAVSLWLGGLGIVALVVGGVWGTVLVLRRSVPALSHIPLWPVDQVIGLVALGAALGVLAVYAASGAGHGYREQWRPGVTAPQGAVDLLMDPDQHPDGGYILSSCVRTRDNETYKYSPTDKVWEEADCVEPGPGWTQVGLAYLTDYASPCKKQWPEFAFLTNTPRRVVTCVSYRLVQGQWFIRMADALDDKGQIWRWQYKGYASDIGRRLLLSTVGGGIVGSIVVLVIGTTWARRRRQ